jgi:hypothetical protein
MTPNDKPDAVEAALNAQPFAYRNDATRVYQFFEDMPVTDMHTVIRAAIAAHAAAGGNGDSQAEWPKELCDWLEKRDMLPEESFDGDTLVQLLDTHEAELLSGTRPPATVDAEKVRGLVAKWRGVAEKADVDTPHEGHHDYSSMSEAVHRLRKCANELAALLPTDDAAREREGGL